MSFRTVVACRFILLFLAAAIGAPVWAQADWSAATSGVTANLWGVCYAGGQFVAVGENGTIITSPDGAKWTSRASGTTAWLTSVAYAYGNYLAVGDSGTVLTSYDGVTWSRVSSDGTTTPSIERLNVAYFVSKRGEFLVAGEHGARETVALPPRISASWQANDPLPGGWWRALSATEQRTVMGGETGLAVYADFPVSSEAITVQVPAGLHQVTGIVFDRGVFTAVGAEGAIVTSPNGDMWTATPSATTANLNAIAAFNNTLVAVGDNGTILSQDASGAWQRRSSPTRELLLGIAASDAAAVIVGGSGTILRATPAPMAPVIVGQPASVTETRDGAAAFTVRANGSLPLSYQWYRSGVALPGETNDTLTVTLTGTSAVPGAISVKVSNPAGAVTSNEAALLLLPEPPAVVDASFAADASLTGIVRALLPLGDGSLIAAFDADAATTRVVKLTPSGSLDRGWSTASFAADTTFGAVTVLALQPDGMILVGGSFVGCNGVSRRNLARLKADGTLDAGFVPAPEASARTVADVVVQSEGRVLVANSGTTPIRLLSDGQLDPDFHPEPLPSELIAGAARNWAVKSLALTSDQRIVVGALLPTTKTLMAPSSDGSVMRLLADGGRDASFTLLRWTGNVKSVRTTSDDGVLVVGGVPPQGSASLFIPFGLGRSWRLRRDGSPVPGYTSPDLSYPVAVSLRADGGFVYYGSGDAGPVAYDPLGAVDPHFTGGIGRPVVLASMADGRVLAGGDFSLYNAKAANRIARLNHVENGTMNAPRILQLVADKTVVHIGELITVRAAVTGSAELTYEWLLPAGITTGDAVRTNTPVFTFAFPSSSASGTLGLNVYNPRGRATATPLRFTVVPDAPTVTRQPTHVSAPSGRDVYLEVSPDPNAGPLDYRWFHNGTDISAPEWWLNRSTLYLPKVTGADAGVYVLAMRNLMGVTVTSAPIVLTLDDSSRFTNLSTRAYVGGGDQTLIAGFMASGTGSRTLLIRGIGPSLARFGVADALPDPTITVYDRGVALLGYTSDDWYAGESSIFPAEFAKVGAFPLDATSKDAAVQPIVGPGAYTVQVSAKPGQSGTALVEVYEDDTNASRITNLSTRAWAEPGKPVIAGLSIEGPVNKRVLLRAVGPGLAAFAINRTLAYPRLTLLDAHAKTLATNNGWQTNGDLAQLNAATAATGAFPLAAGSSDAAMLVTLPPGIYTLTVEAASGEAGVVLIEIYDADDAAGD